MSRSQEGNRQDAKGAENDRAGEPRRGVILGQCWSELKMGVTRDGWKGAMSWVGD